MSDGRYSRRRFLVVIGGAAAGLLCAGCAGQVAVEAEAAPASAENAASQPTAAPTVAAVSAPKRSACPKGLINDPYPGRCKLYRDSNGNGYCDYSEV